MPKNLSDLLTGIICTALGVVILLGFTYAVFVDDYLFKKNAVTTTASVDDVKEVKTEEKVSSMGQTQLTTITRYYIHYSYEDQAKKKHADKWEIAKPDFETWSKEEKKKGGLKLRYDPQDPKYNRPDFERKKGDSFYWVCAAVYGISALMLWIGIESLMAP